MQWYYLKEEGFVIVLRPVSKAKTSVTNKKTLQNYEELLIFQVNWGWVYFKQKETMFWELSSYEPFRIYKSNAYRFHIENFKHLTFTSKQ